MATLLSDGSRPGLPVSKLSSGEQEAIITQMKRIDVQRHPPEKCGSRYSTLDVPYVTSIQPQVMNLELNSCSHNDGKPTTYCGYIDQLLRTMDDPTKLVVRGFPSSNSDVHSVEDYTFLPDVQVRPLYSQLSHRTKENQNCGTHADLGSNELTTSGSQTLEIVFWTSPPGQAWLPPCEHYAEHGMSGFDYNEERTVWRSLAIQAVCFSVQSVIVVNAAAVLPPSATVEQHELKLKTTQEQRQLQTAHSAWFQRELVFDAVTTNRDLETRQEFLTMEEWIKRGEWEDVFTPEEMQPWLKAMHEANVWAQLCNA